MSRIIQPVSPPPKLVEPSLAKAKNNSHKLACTLGAALFDSDDNALHLPQRIMPSILQTDPSSTLTSAFLKRAVDLHQAG